jgi:hypothetical protein
MHCFQTYRPQTFITGFETIALSGFTSKSIHPFHSVFWICRRYFCVSIHDNIISVQVINRFFEFELKIHQRAFRQFLFQKKSSHAGKEKKWRKCELMCGKIHGITLKKILNKFNLIDNRKRHVSLLRISGSKLTSKRNKTRATKYRI